MLIVSFYYYLLGYNILEYFFILQYYISICINVTVSNSVLDSIDCYIMFVPIPIGYNYIYSLLN